MSNCDADNDTVNFTCGNPTVELTEGIIHFFKKKSLKDSINTVQTSTMLCMFGVPSHITVKDLLRFIAPMKSSISEIKIIKGNSMDHYMALVKAISQQESEQFYNTFNGANYNSIEDDICQLMYVEHVEAICSSSGASFPLHDIVELPSCPVCLERLDEPVQGILTTILCNHSFHDDCISQTTDTICPVCRYVQSPEMMEDSQCAVCELRENLWICLICGHVGCGRYGHKHAHLHFQETGHLFALELGKNMVWDYADDAYVHRIAINQEDGKLIQLGEGSETGDKKMDYLNMEFTSILISQLDSQRHYFESQLEKIINDNAANATKLENKLNIALESCAKLEKKVAILTKEKSALTNKMNQATTLAHQLQAELREEKFMMESTAKSQTGWKERAVKAELEVLEAREELRDLMLNFEVRDKIAEIGAKHDITNEDIAGGNITLTENASRGRRRKHKR